MVEPKLQTPSQTSINRFLRGCPMFRELSSAQLDPLAAALQIQHYADGTRLFDNWIPAHGAPLRIITHGHATWEPSNADEKRGGWMLTPGAIFGLGAVSDWARRAQLGDPWVPRDPPRIHCRAVGSLWVLELAPERFDQAFASEGASVVLERLLAMYPTSVHAPRIVALLRDNPHFARVNSVSLYRMLEYAPTLVFRPPPADEPALEAEQAGPEQAGPEQAGPEQVGPEQLGPEQAQPALEAQPIEAKFKLDEAAPKFAKVDLGQIDIMQAKLINQGSALFYVVEGQLRFDNEGSDEILGPGSMGGADVFRPSGDDQPPLATQTTRAVVLDDYALHRMMRGDPGFTRSLGPHVSSAGVKG